MYNKSIIYKIIFHNKKNIFEIYAKKINHSNLLGFIELENIILKSNSQLLLDPLYEKLRLEFKNVNKTYIPLNSVIRIDVINKSYFEQINNKNKSNVHSFPAL